MDSMIIKTDFMKSVVSQMIRNEIHKKTGSQVGLSLSDIEITVDDAGDLTAHVVGDIRIKKEELLYLFQQYAGL